MFADEPTSNGIADDSKAAASLTSIIGGLGLYPDIAPCPVLCRLVEVRPRMWSRENSVRFVVEKVDFVASRSFGWIVRNSIIGGP